ncbi:MAG: hypothetical protein AAGA85_10280 [Bacteroidota bacterium]
MKTLFKNFQYLMLLSVLAIAFTSCEDDFTSEDLIALQGDQEEARRQAAIDAFNNDGRFASVLIKVLTVDNTPVQGATVTMEMAGADTAGLGTQTVTTDASGNASFPDAIAGTGFLSISSADHYDVLGQIAFGSEQNVEELNDGTLVPIKENFAGVISVLPTTGETGTISGFAAVETNLTNEGRESATGAVIRAFYNVTGASGNDDNIAFDDFVFNNNSQFGSDSVGADGSFSIEVPTSADGLTYTLRTEEYQADQTIAVSSVNGVAVRDSVGIIRPEIRQVPTVFGSTVGTASTITQYSGAIIRATDPPAPGRGLGLSFVANGGDANFGTVTAQNALTPTTAGNLRIQTTNLGSTYTVSPSVTISDTSSTVSGVLAEAHIELRGVTALTAGGTLTGFGASANVVFNLQYDHVFFNSTTTNLTDTDTTANQTVSLPVAGSITVTANAAGTITQDSVNVALATAITNDDNYFDPDVTRVISDWITDLKFVNGAAELVVSSANGYLNAIATQADANNDTDNYTNPSISITGDANINVLGFQQPWNVTLNNASNSAGYLLLPTSVDYDYVQIDGTRATSDDVEVINTITTGTVSSNVDIFTLLTVQSSDSTVIYEPATARSYRTSVSSSSMPTARIVERTSERYEFGALNDGQGFSIAVDDAGTITGMTITAGNVTYPFDEQFTASVGDGYSAPATFTVFPGAEGAPGSGATILMGGAFSGLEYVHTTTETITNGGSGYQEFLNLSTARNYSISTTSVTVRPGDDVSVTIDYGTGRRLENVQ